MRTHSSRERTTPLQVSDVRFGCVTMAWRGDVSSHSGAAASRHVSYYYRTETIEERTGR
jgi:hypothetical protein